jgi:predicted  nucleic acid-binding Zn-ribbon protein
MQITCPKCSHLTDDKDDEGLPVTSCPACGVIYAKYNPNAKEDAKAKLKELKKKKPKEEVKPSFREKFSNPIIKRLIIATVSLGVLVALSWVGYGFYKAEKQKQEIASKTAKIKDHIARTLKDPESAQFEKFLLTDIDGACGYVNAKNSMGGYVGFKRFVVEPDNGKVIFEQEDEEENVMFLIDADSFCRNYFFDHDKYQALQQEKLNQAKEQAKRLEEMELERQRSNEEIEKAIEKIRTGG